MKRATNTRGGRGVVGSAAVPRARACQTRSAAGFAGERRAAKPQGAISDSFICNDAICWQWWQSGRFRCFPSNTRWLLFMRSSRFHFALGN